MDKLLEELIRVPGVPGYEERVRTLIRRDYDAAFKTCDVVCTPTTPTPAFALGEKTSEPLEMYLADVFTVSCNLAGLPGLSLPVGFSGGLPIGMQLLGPHFSEDLLFRVARAYERDTDWHQKRPAL